MARATLVPVVALVAVIVALVLCVVLIAVMLPRARQCDAPQSHELQVEWLFHTKVVGVSHCNSDHRSRQKIIREHCRPGQRVTFVPEPDNKFDPDAIGVWTDDGRQIGYLSANFARVTTEKHEAAELVGEISAITGGEYKTFGVNLRIGKVRRTPSPPVATAECANGDVPF